jgi:hypothetical protein
MKWISVKDRLPPNDLDVLAYRDSDGWIVACYYNHYGAFMLDFDQEAYLISHWMPLPEPPKNK